jgi:xanthine dehydrogenase accessory factor
LGWAHSVFDIREDYANSGRFPFAEEIHNCSIDEFLKNEDNNSLNRFSDILLLGHDWSLDQDMLIGILSLLNIDSRARLGAIGSKSKWRAFKKAALESNIQKSLIDATRCPIGISIGAHSPEEIAIAVCAEIISFEKLHNDSEG